MDFIVSALNLVMVLSVLVIAHEWGHFIVAKLCGMHVEDFSLFFGPRLLRIGKFHGTEYNIRSIPLGGFVKISGMEPDDLVLGAAVLRPSLAQGKPVMMHGLSEDSLKELNDSDIGDRVRVITEGAVSDGPRKMLTNEGREELKSLLTSTSVNAEEHKYIETILKADAYVPDPNGYNQKALWQRAAVIFAGPFMSLFFGFILFTVMGFTTGLPYDLKTDSIAQNTEPLIESVSPGKPASLAGLQSGDRVLTIDGQPISTGKNMVDIIHKSAGKELTMIVQRGTENKTIRVTPGPQAQTIEENGHKVTRAIGLIGIAPRITWFRYSPVDAARCGVRLFGAQVTGMLSAIFSKHVGENTGGIIRIAGQIHEDSKQGIKNVLLTAASLSLSLGVINLFPIPVLDGGHLLLLSWEGLRRRKLTSREVLTAQLFGFSIIGVLFVVVTFKDFMQVVLHRG